MEFTGTKARTGAIPDTAWMRDEVGLIPPFRHRCAYSVMTTALGPSPFIPFSLNAECQS
jgi:hypothetical protein